MSKIVCLTYSSSSASRPSNVSCAKSCIGFSWRYLTKSIYTFTVEKCLAYSGDNSLYHYALKCVAKQLDFIYFLTLQLNDHSTCILKTIKPQLFSLTSFTCNRLSTLIGASFLTFLIQLSFTVVGSESQIYVDQVPLYSSNVKGILRYLLGGGGEHAQKPKKKLKKKLHTTFGSVQFLASFISFYFEILSYLACGEKIIKLASKNIVKLGLKSATNF